MRGLSRGLPPLKLDPFLVLVLGAPTFAARPLGLACFDLVHSCGHACAHVHAFAGCSAIWPPRAAVLPSKFAFGSPSVSCPVLPSLVHVSRSRRARCQPPRFRVSFLGIFGCGFIVPRLFAVSVSVSVFLVCFVDHVSETMMLVMLVTKAKESRSRSPCFIHHIDWFQNVSSRLVCCSPLYL